MKNLLKYDEFLEEATRYAGDPRPMTSRYSGTCHTCGKPIKRGEEIIYWPSSRVAGHYACDVADYKHSLASFEDEDTMNRGFMGGGYESDERDRY